jgi:hypothetical protein
MLVPDAKNSKATMVASRPNPMSKMQPKPNL